MNIPSTSPLLILGKEIPSYSVRVKSVLARTGAEKMGDSTTEDDGLQQCKCIKLHINWAPYIFHATRLISTTYCIVEFFTYYICNTYHLVLAFDCLLFAG